MSNLSDMEQLRQREERLEASCQAVAALSRKVGQAKQIIAFDPDRRKRALAEAMTPYLDQGMSATESEARARASFQYGEKMKELARDLGDAEETKAMFESAKIESDSARTLVSLEKELAKL